MTLNEIKNKISITPYYEELNSSGILYCADCLSVLKMLPDKCVDLILTDPPYNLQKDFESDNLSEKEYINFLSPIFNEIAKIIKPKNPVIIFFDNGKKLPLFWKCLFNSKLVFQKGCTYYKPNDVSFPHNRILRKSEVFYVCSNTPELSCDGEEYMHDTLIANWGITEKFGHPTRKNKQIINKIILSHTKKDSIILDCFLGSGTTAVAAKELGRKFIGIEISEKYCAIARKRLAQGILL